MTVQRPVRLPDDLAAAHKALCDACGVTFQGMVEAVVTSQVEWFKEQGQRSPWEWEGDQVTLDRWQEVIMRARKIDAAKRTRS